MADDDDVSETAIYKLEGGDRATNGKTHKAIFQTGFGGSKVYILKEVPTPLVGKYEVQIKVKACGVSFQDLVIQQGATEGLPKTPFTPGFECSGDIVAMGDQVSGFAVGDMVMVLTHYQAWAEVVTVPSVYAFKMPKNMSYEEGAAFPLAYTMAHLMLFHVGNIRQGMKIFAHSLGGSIGIAVAQICKNVVEEVILLGTASAHKHEKLKDLATVVFDLSAEYVFDSKQMYPEGLDLVLDNRYGEDFNKGFALLAPLGKYILYGSSCLVTPEGKSILNFAKSWWHVDKINPTKFMEDNLSLTGINFRKLFFAFPAEQGDRPIVLLRGIMKQLIEWYNHHKIKPIIDSIWAFDELPEAMHKLHNRKNIGTVILDPTREKLIVETSQLHHSKPGTAVDPKNVVEGTVIGNVVMDND
ncbi:unnamed protein product [Gordionus sp. m RMFG-2023]|uniref:synaptic vesicle membrane protein VAT-1 homolog-like n=1 Tax=Gordionus sp. m RMFG-2023 TaxID=3053472 RepID=UPI0030E53B12